MDPNTLKKLNIERAERRACVVLTELDEGRDRLIGADHAQQIPGAMGDAVRKALKSGKSKLVEIDGRQYFLNAHIPSVRIVVIGAVKIAQTLAALAHAVGYHLEIIDPRAASIKGQQFKDVPLDMRWPNEALLERPLDAYCAIVALTHDPKIDDAALTLAADADCFYIGALGSTKNHAKRVERLLAKGVSLSHVERISGPIGMDIGAANPSEIAVSIMAEIIASLRCYS